MSTSGSPLEPNAARELASFAFPKTDLSSDPSSVNTSMGQHAQESNSKEVVLTHGYEPTAHSMAAFQSPDAEWDEYSSRPLSKQPSSLSGRLAERIEKCLVWCVDPKHALLVWLFVIMQSAVITFCLAKMEIIGATPQDRLSMEFGAKKTLFVIVVLKILCLHPSRGIWLYQWAFCPEGDRPQFDEAFPFASTWPKLTWLILIVTHIAFFAQYFWWVSTYIWAEGQTPTWATVLPLVLGLPGLFVAILQKVLEKKYFRMNPRNADYEDERKIAKALQTLPKEWRVAIRVARPGQAPLELATVKRAPASQAV